MKLLKTIFFNIVLLVSAVCMCACGRRIKDDDLIYLESDDQIIGTWFYEYSNEFGNMIKETEVINADGTGYWFTNAYDAKTSYGQLVCYRTKDEDYVVSFSDGYSRFWKLDTETDVVTSSSGTTLERKIYGDVTGPEMFGSWYNEKTKDLFTFNADGSGTTYKGEDREISTFTWTVPESGIVLLKYLSGTGSVSGEPMSGREISWQYDAEKDRCIISTSGSELVRATEDMDGFTVY